MKIIKVNKLILDSAEKQVLRNASILIDKINQSMENNEIEDDLLVSLDDLKYVIDEIANKEYLGY